MVKKFYLFLSVVCLLFTVAFTMVASAQSETIQQINLTGVDSSRFPDVSLTINPVMSGNEIFSNDQIDLYENGQPISSFGFQKADSLPSHTVFLIDNGEFSNLKSFEQIVPSLLTSFIDNGYFRNGIDSASILTTVDAPSPVVALLEQSTSADAFRSAIGQLTFPTNNAKVRTLEAILNAVSRLKQIGETGKSTLSIVYVGSLLTDSVGRNSSLGKIPEIVNGQLIPSDIRFYALHTELETVTPDYSYVEHFQRLSNDSRGKYLRIFINRDNILGVTEIYNDILIRKSSYQLSYRSASSTTGARTVTVLPKGFPVTSAPVANQKNYTVNPQPPKIEFLLPASVTRTLSNPEDGNSAKYDISSVTGTVKILDWPDGFERNIEQITLEVDGQQQGLQENVGDQTEYPFIIPIDQITKESKTLALRVTVKDELGLEQSVTKNLVVTAVIPITATPPTIPQSKTPIERIIDIAPLIISLLSLAGVVILGLFAYRNREKVGAAVSYAVKEVKKTILGGGGGGSQPLLAKLKVVTARRDLMDMGEIPIYSHTTTFGRDPKQCDINLFDEDDRSSVSGLHCTLQYDVPRRTFIITDDNSTAGTRINGRSIPANDPVELRDGDEIVLGDIVRRGAKLIYIAVAQPVVPDVFPQYGGISEIDTLYDRELEDIFGKPKSAPPAETNKTILLNLPDEIDVPSTPPIRTNPLSKSPKPQKSNWLDELE